MDNRPIGVFDSGMGGLTAMRQLIECLPNEDIVYFGDTGRVPYGGRSAETIIKYARQDVAFLSQFDPKAIVIACGTVSTTALSLLLAENPIPILGVVEPAARAAAAATRNGRIGIIGTKASIRSGAYENAIRRCRRDVMLISRHCPLFVSLVENGRVAPGDPVTEQVVLEYLDTFRQAGVDTLVLGCTHYPLLHDIIGNFMGPGVTLIDTGRECALSLKEELTRTDGLSDRTTPGSRHYYASDSAQDFAQLASVFLGGKIAGKVDRVEIDRY